MNKNNLDERQEQILLKIEHNSCWIAYWGLLAVMVIQLIIYGFDVSRLAGEWIIFMVLCLYLGYTCMKNGIWDRRLKPNRKTNFLVSLAAGAAMAIIIIASTVVRFHEAILASVFMGLITGAFTFALCYVALALSSKALKKRQAELENEEEEE